MQQTKLYFFSDELDFLNKTGYIVIQLQDRCSCKSGWLGMCNLGAGSSLFF
jgi:hypothetical protein